MPNKLELCAGRKRDGWVTLDANGRCDVTATIPPLPPSVRDTRWDEIRLIHGIEHFYRWDVPTLLESIHSVLAPGGLLVLEQPNIEYAAKVLLGQVEKPKGHRDQFDMWPLYGDPSHRTDLYSHRWGYSPRTLTQDLVDAGFRREDVRAGRARSHFPVRDFRIEARRASTTDS